MKAYGGVALELHLFFTWPLDGSEWSTSHFGHSTPGKGPSFFFNRRLSGPEKWSGLFEKRGIGTPYHPIRSLVSVPTSYPGCPEGKQLLIVTLTN